MDESQDQPQEKQLQTVQISQENEQRQRRCLIEMERHSGRQARLLIPGSEQLHNQLGNLLVIAIR